MMCEICPKLTRKALDRMCETKFLQMCSFSIILTSLRSFNLSFQLPLYVIFTAIPNLPPWFLAPPRWFPAFFAFPPRFSAYPCWFPTFPAHFSHSPHFVPQFPPNYCLHHLWSHQRDHQKLFTLLPTWNYQLFHQFLPIYKNLRN